MRHRKIRWTAAALVLAATSLAGTAPAGAQEAAPGVTPVEQTVFEQYDLNASQAADLAARVEQVSLVLFNAQADLDAAQQRADDADRHLAEVRAGIAEAERRLAEETARLQAKAVRAYIGGREEVTLPVAEVLSEKASPTEAGSRAAYTHAVISDQRTTVARVTEARDTVRGLRAEAEELQATAAGERDGVGRRRDEIRRQRDHLESLRRQAAERAAQDLMLVGDVVGRGQDHALRTAGARAASDSIARRLLVHQWGGALVGPTVAHLSRPVAGARFSSGFGVRADPVTGEPARHEGIDFAVATGTPITAPADGVVLFAGEVEGYGNATVIDHGNGVGTLYGHQSELLVLPGQAVLRGDVIGKVGNTGKSTGPHLHFEVRLFGVPEEPRPYLAP